MLKAQDPLEMLRDRVKIRIQNHIGSIQYDIEKCQQDIFKLQSNIDLLRDQKNNAEQMLKDVDRTFEQEIQSVFEDLKKGLKEAIEFEEGEVNLETTTMEIEDDNSD